MPNPVAFTVFGIDIRWYGILIALGMVLAVAIAAKRCNRHGIVQDDVIDVVLYAVPAGIIGARAYYCLFNWDFYSRYPEEIINFRAGGLAIHGGLILGALTVWLVCRRKKISVLNFLDLIVPGVALAQSIGRWGNYFNSEAHGGPTDLPWGIMVYGEKVHPTFLYESIWCFGLFILLLILDNREHFQGKILCLYGILYSLERVFVEALRTDSLMIGPFKQAQLLSITVILICVIAYIVLDKKYKNTKELN
ncbi:MAG: prolipoprotein diacylglyceryl transferase [Eubacterium sp.]|nr:prolipoprotein diacylglyceryl transferase [Eubacterium sp.]